MYLLFTLRVCFICVSFLRHLFLRSAVALIIALKLPVRVLNAILNNPNEGGKYMTNGRSDVSVGSFLIYPTHNNTTYYSIAVQ